MTTIPKIPLPPPILNVNPLLTSQQNKKSIIQILFN
jgi:hypothetical protein